MSSRSERISRKLSTGLEPFALSIADAADYTSESNWKVKRLLATGEYEAVKAGRRTLVTLESIKRRLASLPRAKYRMSNAGNPVVSIERPEEA